MATCKVCGTPHATCGGPTTVVPVDRNITPKENTMGALKRYTVTDEKGREASLMLNEDDAKKLGAKPAGKNPPANKAAAPQASKPAAKAPASKPAAKAPASKPAAKAPASKPAGN